MSQRKIVKKVFTRKKQLALPGTDADEVDAQSEERKQKKSEPETLVSMLQEAQVKTPVKTYIAKITPELAEILLGNNEGNRPLKKRVLETYVRDMEAGDFELTGETIILDDKWKLLNGQHRLNACILSKQPFTALIVQGVKESVYLKLDSGEKRRAADWMVHYGEDNAKVLAAALRVLWTWEQGMLCSNKRYPSNDEIAHTRDNHPGIRRFNVSTFAKSVKGMPGSLTMALRYIFGQYDDALAEKFFDHLATGERLTRQNPILLLRERLLSAKGKDRLSQMECAALTIKTWNAFVGGGEFSPHHLRFRTGKNGEEFPKILGVEEKIEPKKKGA